MQYAIQQRRGVQFIFYSFIASQYILSCLYTCCKPAIYPIVFPSIPRPALFHSSNSDLGSSEDVPFPYARCTCLLHMHLRFFGFRASISIEIVSPGLRVLTLSHCTASGDRGACFVFCFFFHRRFRVAVDGVLHPAPVAYVTLCHLSQYVVELALEGLGVCSALLILLYNFIPSTGCAWFNTFPLFVSTAAHRY